MTADTTTAAALADRLHSLATKRSPIPAFARSELLEIAESVLTLVATQARPAEPDPEPYAWFWTDKFTNGVLQSRDTFEKHRASHANARYTPVWTAPRSRLAGKTSTLAPAGEGQEAVAWPVMPPSKGQSNVLFEDGYAEGWAKCLSMCKAAVIAVPAHPSVAAQALSSQAKLEAAGPVAWDDVLAERQRQIGTEGWTPEHDDAHKEGEMCFAAAGYACAASDALQAIERQFDGDGKPTFNNPASLPHRAPWPHGWEFKKAPVRRQLVKAGALILAEIERIDRLLARGPVCSDCGARKGGPHNYGCMYSNLDV